MVLQVLQVLFQRLSLAWAVGMPPGVAQSFDPDQFPQQGAMFKTF